MIDISSKISWWFARLVAGTMQTSGLRSLLEGAHLSPAEMFVREVTQNSVDAHAGSTAPVHMRFSSFTPSGSQLQALRDFLLQDGSLARRLGDFAGRDGFSQNGGSLSSDASVVPRRSLLVEDYGTIGLGGEIGGDGVEDHFSRLVYFFGQSHGEGTTGGAFGFGKSVYSVASDVRTVIYYTRPLDGSESRLIAVGLYPNHELDGYRFTGYALCGRIIPGEHYFPIAPLVGKQADEIAVSLGMKARGPEDAGTSLLLVDCEYTIEELRNALEKWWWPRLVTTGSQGLIVNFEDEGRSMSPPDPASRGDLTNFIRAFEHHLDARQDTDETKTKQIRSTGRRNVGKLTLRKIEAVEQEDEEDAWHTYTVALFRSPRLVVEYAPFGRRHLTPFVGVFVADDGVDSILRDSENPAHDTWSPDSGRLAEGERAFVRAVGKYGKQFAREFQASFLAKPVRGTSRYGELEDLLGRAFKRGASAGPVPPGPERPISLSVKERRNEAAGFDEAHIIVKSKAGIEELPAVITVTAHLLGDAKRSRVDSLEVALTSGNGGLAVQGKKPEMEFVVGPDAPATFTAQAKPPQDSAVMFEVAVSGEHI